MNTYLLRSFIVLLIAFVVCGCTLENKTEVDASFDSLVIDRTPSNPNSVPAVHKTLALFADLTEGKRDGVISGQNAGHGNEIIEDYAKFIGAINQASGEKPGIVGLDYEFQRQYTLEELLTSNQYLINHWQTGGWVMVTWSPNNPWGRGKIFDSNFTQFPEANIMDLITDGTEMNRKWIERLDIIAEALKHLSDNGVIVLWRPMQEMNGDWFWWGKPIMKNRKGVANVPSPNNPSLKKDHPEYVKLFRHMFHYFTYEKKLNNLLWVFAPNFDQAFSTYPYPGDDVVDIVAPTEYSDTLVMSGYRDALQYGKPIGFSEWGQSVWDDTIDHGELDNTLYLERLKNDFPKAAFWVTWHSWYKAPVALIDNQNTKELMQAPYLINHGANEIGINSNQ